MRKKLTLSIVALLLSLMAAGAMAQTGTDSYIELMRSDLRADKQAIVTAAMELTDDESKLFWPVYREYETERIVLGDRTLELIKKYPGAVQVTTPDTIRTLAEDWFKLQDDRVKLMKKYYAKIEKSISPRVAARWMQVEHRVWLLIQLQMAAEVPLIEPIHQK